MIIHDPRIEKILFFFFTKATSIEGRKTRKEYLQQLKIKNNVYLIVDNNNRRHISKTNVL